MAQQIAIDQHITVGALAEKLSVPVSKLIAELLKNGVMATVNEKIDYDTAQIIVGELELDIELARAEAPTAAPREKRSVSDKAEPRPPVVAFMGHVDHGKTSLLDAIREAEVAAGESGGITQHLSAYQIEHDGRLVTLLDTPGHEAFAALREHGARLTDVVVIVVAGDDGVKPQTLEAIRFARGAGVKMIVAVNKMDRPDANINMVKQQLSENDLMPEDYGGETVVLPVSAKTKDGLKELVDMIILVADVEDLRADADGPAEGLIIESHMEKGRGPVAIALIEQGTLQAGDYLVVGDTYGKIRNLESTTGKPINEAKPSTPAVITGLKALPEFGEQFFVTAGEKEAKSRAVAAAESAKAGGAGAATTGGELLRIISRTEKLTEFNVVVKADVQGSLTSVIDSLKTLDNEEVAVRVVSSGVGVISESDVHTAATSGAVIYGFHTSMPVAIKQLAARDNVSVRLFTVIYELIDDVKREMEALLAPEVLETDLAKLIVKGVFKTAKAETIAGGEVTTGKITLPALARVKREKEVLGEDLEVTSLKRGPSDVPEVPAGEMCGFSLKTETRLNIAEGDRVEFYSRETRTRKLEAS